MFGGLAASGWHTAAITMRLMVDLGVPAGGLIGAGGEIAWPRPTRPGDTLRVVSEVLEVVPSRSRNDRGTVVMRNETRNQRDEIVQLFTAKLIAFLRNVMLSKSNATGNAAAMPQAQLGTISTMRSMGAIVDTAALAFCVPVLPGTAGFRVGGDASLAQAAASGSTVACTISDSAVVQWTSPTRAVSEPSPASAMAYRSQQPESVPRSVAGTEVVEEPAAAIAGPASVLVAAETVADRIVRCHLPAAAVACRLPALACSGRVAAAVRASPGQPPTHRRWQCTAVWTRQFASFYACIVSFKPDEMSIRMKCLSMSFR